jgi:hypothetical protein
MGAPFTAYKVLSLQKNCHAQWGPALRREVVYVASCLVFAVTGVWVLIYTDTVHEWLAAPTGEWTFFSKGLWRAEGMALFLQAFLSLASDAIYTDVPSIAHPLDRLLAMLLAAVAIYIEITIVLFAPLSLPLRLLMVGIVSLALACHFRAKAAIRRHNYAGYVRNHTIWHFAIASSMVAPLHIALLLI